MPLCFSNELKATKKEKKAAWGKKVKNLNSLNCCRALYLIVSLQRVSRSCQSRSFNLIIRFAPASVRLCLIVTKICQTFVLSVPQRTAWTSSNETRSRRKTLISLLLYFQKEKRPRSSPSRHLKRLKKTESASLWPSHPDRYPKRLELLLRYSPSWQDFRVTLFSNFCNACGFACGILSPILYLHR